MGGDYGRAAIEVTNSRGVSTTQQDGQERHKGEAFLVSGLLMQRPLIGRGELPNKNRTKNAFPLRTMAYPANNYSRGGWRVKKAATKLDVPT
jgi:hypothetical protein